MKMKDFEVVLLKHPYPQTLSVAGALSCFKQEPSYQIMEELLALPEYIRLKEERVLKKSLGRGHGSVGDQNCFFFSIKDLPRAVTFQLCLLEYLVHLQQSFRRTTASRGFYLPEVIKKSEYVEKTKEILSQSFRLYNEMQRGGIPGEDARFLLPLYTKTNIQTGGDARELCHLRAMSQDEMVPSVVHQVVEEMISKAGELAPSLFKNFGFNYERLAWRPAAQLYSKDNGLFRWVSNTVTLISSNAQVMSELVSEEMIDRAIKERNEADLSVLKHIDFEFVVPISLVSLHQLIRQRTLHLAVESIYRAVERNEIVVPPSIIRSPTFFSLYQEQYRGMMAHYQDLLKAGIPPQEAIGVIPHSLKTWAMIRVDGWNVIHFIGKRTCIAAQWEIREIAEQIASIIIREFPALGKWAAPQCITYGECPEKGDCGYYRNV